MVTIKYKINYKNYSTRGAELMLPPGLQIYVRPRVTLTFDLTPKVDSFMPLPCGPFMPTGNKSVNSFLKYRVHKFGNR